MAWSERRIRVWGTDTLVLEEGDPHDPAAVFLHGLGSGARAWEPVIPAIAARGVRCFAVDLPGFGETPPPAPPRSLPRPGRQVVEYVAELLDRLGLPRAHLVGWSMGGGVALNAAAAMPHRVDRLVLSAPAGLGPAVAWGLRLMALPLVGRRMLASPLPALPPGDGPVRVPAVLARQPLPRSFAAYHVEIARQSWFSDVQHRALRAAGLFLAGQRRMMPALPLERLAAPTLLLWGRQDRIIPYPQGVEAARRIPHARLELYDDCGHCLPAERPARFADDAARFLHG